MHPFTVKSYEHIFVLRDDLIAGGTKRRALDILLQGLTEKDVSYAGTIFGYGALALAHACEAAGKTAHLYLSCNNLGHPMLEHIRATGAVIERCEALPVEQLHREIAGEYIFPLGFDTPEFHTVMVDALRQLDISPYSEIWCPVVSGTLAKGLAAAFPGTPIKTVGMAKSTQADFYAPEKYHRPVAQPPPYPACPYTDAKVWQFARVHAAPNAVIWNVAG